MKLQVLYSLVAASLAFAEPIGNPGAFVQRDVEQTKDNYIRCFSQYFIGGLQYCGGYPDCVPLANLRACMIKSLGGFTDTAPSEETLKKSFDTCRSQVSKTVQENSSLTSQEKETVLQSLGDRQGEALSLNKSCAPAPK
ncbi:hypothetical protein BDV37DRAFT_281812 [Aspergillus pseudonomiae]|uniref:Secreted protein n=1 Tax=Aspergillus pseudonomiae TaxID=1506151 RepID=A0A5N7DG35_9EURO|nr:uncharacterized protein BDV37DRAFT_281812 [Aspergillus pseudonomiae]KAE8405406.1 hypothetical protein BDV37DRAFT_281812 [Aspergillus pseudonomiae]